MHNKHNHHTAVCRHTLCFALAALFLSSCATADGDDNTPATGGIPVGFSALAEWREAADGNGAKAATRLAEGTDELVFGKGDAIGVFAYHDGSSTPDFMNNQCVTYDGSAWTYSPTKYWLTDESDRLSFYAYYPWRESTDGDTIHATSLAAEPLAIKYCSTKANIDLMASQKVEALSHAYNNGTVSLAFRHLLARVRFSFTYEGSGEYHPVIHVMKFTIPHHKGTATYTSDHELEWTLDNDDASVQVTRYVSDAAGTVLHEKNQIIPEFTVYLLPYAFPCSSASTDNIGDFTISLNNKFYTYTPKSQISLEAGKSYTINFKVTNDYGGSGNYFITSYSIWKDGESIEGTLE